MGAYSTSADAAKKQQIDDDIAKQNIPIDMHDEDYLKALVAACSEGKSKVVGNAHGLQFFIVKGGAEGFLDHDRYKDKDASRMQEGDTSTLSGASSSYVYDENDLLITFDKSGKLIGATQMRRPLSIVGDPEHRWTEPTANRVY